MTYTDDPTAVQEIADLAIAGATPHEIKDGALYVVATSEGSVTTLETPGYPSLRSVLPEMARLDAPDEVVA